MAEGCIPIRKLWNLFPGSSLGTSKVAAISVRRRPGASALASAPHRSAPYRKVWDRDGDGATI